MSVVKPLRIVSNSVSGIIRIKTRDFRVLRYAVFPSFEFVFFRVQCVSFLETNANMLRVRKLDKRRRERVDVSTIIT